MSGTKDKGTQRGCRAGRRHRPRPILHEQPPELGLVAAGRALDSMGGAGNQRTRHRRQMRLASLRAMIAQPCTPPRRMLTAQMSAPKDPVPQFFPIKGFSKIDVDKGLVKLTYKNVTKNQLHDLQIYHANAKATTYVHPKVKQWMLAISTKRRVTVVANVALYDDILEEYLEDHIITESQCRAFLDHMLQTLQLALQSAADVVF